MLLELAVNSQREEEGRKRDLRPDHRIDCRAVVCWPPHLTSQRGESRDRPTHVPDVKGGLMEETDQPLNEGRDAKSGKGNVKNGNAASDGVSKGKIDTKEGKSGK